jgi:hypothetical protein
MSGQPRILKQHIRKASRYQQTERCSCARENKPDAYLIEGAREPNKLVVFIIDNRDKEHESRQQHARNCHKKSKSR